MDNLVLSRTKAWFEDKELEYRFPGEWNVQILSHLPIRVLNQKEIYQKIQNPIGCSPLSNYLQPGMKVCIISDDISRPTRTDIIIPILLDYLKQNKIANESISIVISSGTHGKMSQFEKTLKFGSDILKKVKVIDHDFKNNLVFMGNTSLGTPVYVNETVAKSDLLLGIGGIHPHSQTGFSGGAKLILGVSGIKTILYFHDRRKQANRGGSVNNELRNDMTDAARLCNMNFIINTIISQEREIVDVFVGDLEHAYIEGVQKARYLYRVPNPGDLNADLIIADTYPFDISCSISRKGWWPIYTNNVNSQRLIIAAAPNGIDQHILFPLEQQGNLNTIRMLKRKLQTHSMAEIVMLLLKKLYIDGVKNKISFTKKRTSANPDTHKSPVLFLHDLDVDLNLKSRNFLFYNNISDCFDHIQRNANREYLKVCFYRASSLTFSIIPEFK